MFAVGLINFTMIVKLTDLAIKKPENEQTNKPKQNKQKKTSQKSQPSVMISSFFSLLQLCLEKMYYRTFKLKLLGALF